MNRRLRGLMIRTRRTFLGVDRRPSNVQIEGCIPSRLVVINEFDRRQLEELRAQINEKFKQRTASAVSGVSRPRIYRKEKT